VDTLGIFWIVIFSILAIVSFIEMRRSSSVSSPKKADNHNNSNNHKPYCIDGITERQQGLGERISISNYTCDKCCKTSNDETGDYDNKDSFPHNKTSITVNQNTSQSKDTRR
jgi:hypothetical protein